MRTLAQIWSCRRAVAAIEMAIVTPVLLTLLLGSVETVQMLRSSGRIQTVAFTVGDLVTQQKDLTTTELNNIYQATDLILAPFPTAALSIGVASVTFTSDENATPTLAWTESRNGGTVDQPLTLATPFAAAGQSVIIVTVDYAYLPIFANFIFGPLAFSETIYARPRKSTDVKRT